MERPEPIELRTLTSTTLLEGLRDPNDRTRWNQFVDRYRPTIVAFARGRGLTEDEAEDLAQTALLDFARAYGEGRYRSDKGALRGWLFGFVRIELASHWRARGRAGNDAESLDTRHAEALGSDDELEARWDEQWRRAVLATALEEVRATVEPRTFRAFERFGLEERPSAEVAAELGMTENAVYGAKRRVLERLKEILPLIEETW